MMYFYHLEFRVMSLDLRQILEHPKIYTLYQKIVGGYRARQLFTEKNIKANRNDKILDIGCGPGDILDFLPESDYTGIDIDSNYIKQAKCKYGKRGRFICVDISNFNLKSKETFDIVICIGVLHHLDNEECHILLELAKNALKPNGRFISFDGVFTENQSKISKYFLRKDRGKYIRNTSNYLKLVQNSFSITEYSIDETYFRIPYTSIIIECRK